MKTILTIAVLSTLGLSAGVVSAAPHNDVATVISSTPVYERVAAPRRECVTEQVTAYDERRSRRPIREEYVPESRSSSGAGTVLGAIVGGVIGHQFGNSTGGRDHGTAAGAVLGGLIGNSMERNSGGDRYDAGYSGNGSYSRAAYDVERVPVTRDVQRCNVVSDYREEVRGYDVRYSFNGREYMTRLAYDPGPTLPINVDVRPSYRAPVPSYSNRY
ncbi:MAG: glycine zipper 2TM domain-containing protein [Betaproteobacteria bacterium]|nr:glycine zipper 2TM domain-containing protein [Betaproteobacteria bacterium]